MIVKIFMLDVCEIFHTLIKNDTYFWRYVCVLKLLLNVTVEVGYAVRYAAQTVCSC
ncbi:hypothetical protein CRENPOLYSF2_3840006 [Crenothrix polyspora]|uniref:Uncharacterized protein n=1 Tax=Crenothrix polyspora TaxID=360316 RepID=A0A1R4HDE2_9GAMM|nr:hypothetical protein CRENPOLYSF2_3840006 [Crenothrix polyspora]